LALLTVAIFFAAFVFLMLFLVTPLFFSLNHPLPSNPETHSHSHALLQNMSTPDVHESDDEHSGHEHSHEDRRRRRDVTSDMQQQMLKLCGCDSVADSDATKLRKCMSKCFGGRRSNGGMMSGRPGVGGGRGWQSSSSSSGRVGGMMDGRRRDAKH
jgi:hypothetical protein